MRISDCISDVFSSDLLVVEERPPVTHRSPPRERSADVGPYFLARQRQRNRRLRRRNVRIDHRRDGGPVPARARIAFREQASVFDHLCELALQGAPGPLRKHIMPRLHAHPSRPPYASLAADLTGTLHLWGLSPTPR